MRLTLATILIACTAAHATAEPKSDASLDELRVASAPKQQSDLDTMRIAAAHRERADSVQQKTTGLWQSWLVSICEGCNPNQRRPAEIDSAADSYIPTYKMSGAVTAKTVPTADGSRASQSAGRGRSRTLVSDLSDENVSQIRKMPRQ